MRDSDWQLLLSRIKNGACTPFLGAGACAGTLPLGGEIAARWAEEHEYPLEDPHDLARVAVPRCGAVPREVPPSPRRGAPATRALRGRVRGTTSTRTQLLPVPRTRFRWSADNAVIGASQDDLACRCAARFLDCRGPYRR